MMYDVEKINFDYTVFGVSVTFSVAQFLTSKSFATAAPLAVRSGIMAGGTP
jgi:hypothetical protein